MHQIVEYGPYDQTLYFCACFSSEQHYQDVVAVLQQCLSLGNFFLTDVKAFDVDRLWTAPYTVF